MLHPTQLHQYQRAAVGHLLDHQESMLHLDMGLGKTIITLSAMQTLKSLGMLGGTLVVAPLRPARTVWEKEARNWSHTRGLTFSYILGDAHQRIRALFAKADVYVINYENLAWLALQLRHYFLSQGKYPPFQMLVWDEISKMKNASSKRVAAFLSVLPYIQRRVGLTGTPASNGLKDMHGQYLMVDSGARLGISKGNFEQRFFSEQGHTLTPFPDTMSHIAALVGDITLQMRAEDYLDMPELIYNDVWVDLPARARGIYDQVETELFAELDSGARIELFNEASKSNKCLQIANGAAYLEPGQPQYETIHTAKLDAWADIRSEIGDNPLLTSYSFKFDYKELEKTHLNIVNMSTLKGHDIDKAEEDFNLGRIRDMVGHPASIGHGLNLQKACNHVCTIGLNWSLDLYQQFIARVRRQGQQKNHVMLHRILARDTLDEVVAQRLISNDETQSGVRDAIQQYRNQKR